MIFSAIFLQACQTASLTHCIEQSEVQSNIPLQLYYGGLASPLKSLYGDQGIKCTVTLALARMSWPTLSYYAHSEILAENRAGSAANQTKWNGTHSDQACTKHQRSELLKSGDIYSRRSARSRRYLRCIALVQSILFLRKCTEFQVRVSKKAHICLAAHLRIDNRTARMPRPDYPQTE